MQNFEMLNESQKKAVEHPLKPLLIVAGAGTGKTKVISERFLFLVKNLGLKAEEILTITFTNKATTEMLDRIEPNLNSYTDLWITNFHKFGERVLRESGIEIDLNQFSSVLSEKDIVFLVKKNVKKFQFNFFLSQSNPETSVSRLVPSFEKLNENLISSKKYKNFIQNFSFEKFLNSLKKEKRENIDLDFAYNLELQKFTEFADIYEQYEKFKLEHGILSIADLISKPIQIFEEKPNVLLRFRRKFKACLIDEFQDTNFAQNRLIELLFPPKNSPLTIVGDDKQAIYGFRGSTLKNILDFPKKYETTTIFLEKNYRSQQKILDLAFQISKNSKVETLEKSLGNEKPLKTAKLDLEEKIPKVLEFDNFLFECEWVANEIEKLLSLGVNPKEVAVLSQNTRELEYINLELLGRKIETNFELKENFAFAGSNVINLFVTLLRTAIFKFNSDLLGLLVNPVLNLPKQKILDFFIEAEKRGNSLFDEIIKTKTSLFADSKILKILDEVEQLTKKENLVDSLTFILNETEYFKKIILGNETRDFEAVEAIVSEVRKFLEKFPFQNSVINFLEYIGALTIERGKLAEIDITPFDNLEKNDENDKNAVNILTVHRSKGLEFEYVFLINFTKTRNRSDSKNSLIPDDLINSEESDADEKRRVFYVAVTRPKKSLIISWSTHHPDLKQLQKPNEFLEEIIDFADFERIEVNTRSDSLQKFSNLEKISESDKNLIQKHKKFSHSKIETFKSCPKKFYFKYIKKIPEEQQKETIFGSVLHDAILNLNQNFVSFGKFDEEKILAQLTNKFDRLDNKNLILEKAKTSIQKYIREFLEKKIEILEIEQNYSKNFGNFLFEGRIDLVANIDGIKTIVDFKTKEKAKNWISYYDVEFEEQEKNQIKEYFILVPDAKKGILWEITTSIPNATLEIFQNEKTAEKIIESVEKIRKSDFLAEPGNFKCEYCPFREICKEGREFLEKKV